MPLIESEFVSPFYMFSGHMETILPALFRNVGNIVYSRERISTPDQDFLDLDWSLKDSDNLVIISHGLEGDTRSPYLLGMVKAINTQGWDVLTWNYRGCSEEMNRLCRFYHSGESHDLDLVVHHALSKKSYKTLILIGFSIGGNITLKYLGEKGQSLNPLIKASVCFSVPCHLESGAMHLAKFKNKVYLNRFLKSLKSKILTKEKLMPGTFDISDINRISNFLEFDDKYTAPLHGFENAKHYWHESSSIFYLPQIAIPTLLVNAKNDPFLPEECFPVNEAKNNPFLFLEMPNKGGHVGFLDKTGHFWSEKRAIEFIKNYI